MYKPTDRGKAHECGAVSGDCGYGAPQKDFPTEHMLLLHHSIHSAVVTLNSFFVGIKVGKLEDNSLEMHAPSGLWGICS